MTSTVCVIGNGESRRGLDPTRLKSFSTVIGCNAQFRDYNFEHVVCCDRHMCKEAVETVGPKTTVYTRPDWWEPYRRTENVKRLPRLPYNGTRREDDPFHWGTGPHAANLARTMKPKTVYLIGFDLYSKNDTAVNNIYKSTPGYTYITEPVNPRMWIHQFDMLFYKSPGIKWILINNPEWNMPAEWARHSHVSLDTYENFSTLIKEQENANDR